MRTLALICCLVALIPSFRAKEGSAGVRAPDHFWIKFDEYSNLPLKEERVRLGKFITQLRAEKSSTAYIVAHAGRRSCEGEAKARADRVRKYLIRSGRIEASRIRTIDAGHQDEWSIALYTAPPNAPELTPDIIKASEWQLAPEQVQTVRNCKGKFYGKH